MNYLNPGYEVTLPQAQRDEKNNVLPETKANRRHTN